MNFGKNCFNNLKSATFNEKVISTNHHNHNSNSNNANTTNNYYGCQNQDNSGSTHNHNQQQQHQHQQNNYPQQLNQNNAPYNPQQFAQPPPPLFIIQQIEGTNDDQQGNDQLPELEGPFSEEEKAKELVKAKCSYNASKNAKFGNGGNVRKEKKIKIERKFVQKPDDDKKGMVKVENKRQNVDGNNKWVMNINDNNHNQQLNQSEKAFQPQLKSQDIKVKGPKGADKNKAKRELIEIDDSSTESE